MDIYEKPSRGRPKGSGKDDSRELAKVADLIAYNPILKHTTAIKKVIGTRNSSDIRRLQVKFRDDKENLMSDARTRLEQKEKIKDSRIATLFMLVDTVNRSPIFDIVKKINKSPLIKTMTEVAKIFHHFREKFDGNNKINIILQ